FMKQIKLQHITLGRHGGGELLEKLMASVERERELASFVLKNAFDASFSYISPEAARISFGIGLCHYICSDSPHASAPARLAVPLAARLFSPFAIAKERWTQYGVKDSQVFAYHALDPWAWLIPSLPRTQLSKSRTRLVLIRLEESLASYMQSGKGVSASLEELMNLIEKEGDFEIMLIPRYDEQREWAKKKFGSRTTVPTRPVDGPELVSRADIVIGGGGTMTQEAALLGIPNISYFPSANLDVFENFYFPKKLSIKASTHRELLMQTRKLIQNLDLEAEEFVSSARRATDGFEDPVKFIFRNIQPK
ncbi:MAG: DUF354 domain-containing protein, partial [Nitrososphaerales archaeon]